MKHTQKLSIFYALFFVLMCTGMHAQKFDIDEFHIPDDLDLSDSEYDRLQNIGKQLKEKLVADLQVLGYDIILPRKSKIKLERVGIQDIRLDYDREADRIIFGKLLIANNYITLNTYLYGAENGIRTSHEPLTANILSRKMNEFNDSEEINDAVSKIIDGLFPDRPKVPIVEVAPAPKKPTVVVESKPKPATIPKVESEKPKKEKAPKPKKLKKEKEEKTPKISKVATGKVCNKTPGKVLVVAGGLIGGAGFYLRSKALKIYDEDYKPIVGEPNARPELDKARKSNRMAHILGAGAVLTAGVGAYLWARCAKKSKNNLSKYDLQITPQLEYNANMNANTIAARLSFKF